MPAPVRLSPIGKVQAVTRLLLARRDPRTILFNSFAVNMVLQYRRVGKWRDYLFGERIYILLSLIAKTALAWQIFANTLID